MSDLNTLQHYPFLLNSTLFDYSPNVRVDGCYLCFTGGTERNYCSCGD